MMGALPLAGAALSAWLAIVPAALSQQVASTVPPFSAGARAASGLPQGWQPFAFREIAPTRYALVVEDSATVVRSDANATASGLVFRFDTPVNAAQTLRWRWKGERLPADGDTRERRSDDAIARIYLMFRTPPARQNPVERARDATLRLIYGEAPPQATLLYVWDTRAPSGASFPNPHSDRVRNIVVESGPARLGEWLSYERDIVADYRAAFGEEPPALAAIAIMSDADDTRGRANARFGDIAIVPR